MRILSLLVLSAFTLSIVTYCPQASENEEEYKEFLRSKKLSIEPVGITRLHTSGDIPSTWKKWVAYRGFDPISEEEFFRITGYNAEAEKVESHKRSGRSRMLLGFGIGIADVALLLKGWSEFEVTSPNNDNVLFQRTSFPNELTLAGAIVSGIGGAIIRDGALMSRMNWAPYSVAESIANEYNRSLEAKIAAGIKGTSPQQ